MKGIEIKISGGDLIGEIYKDRTPDISKLMRRTTYQARLGRKMDNIARKVFDNNIRLASQPTDMLRIKVNRDKISQDLLSRTIVSAEIVPIIFPSMKDVPLRRLIREDGEDILVPNLYQFYDDQFWTIYVPAEIRLDEDDLLIRIIYDPYSDEPNILCIQVKEILTTLGYNSIVYLSARVTLYDESLPSEVVNIIKETILVKADVNIPKYLSNSLIFSLSIKTA